MGQHRFVGRSALVTGAAGSLGRAVVRGLLSEGAHVTAADISSEALATLVEELSEYDGSIHPAQVDLMNEQTTAQVVDECVTRHDGLDFVANIAGGYLGDVDVSDMTSQQWDFMQDLNVRTTRNVCRAAVPSMRARAFGKIVNVSARAGLTGAKGLSAYAVAKAGVRVLTESLAAEVQDDGINVNAIMPSIIDTEANRRSIPRADHSRWVAPDDIARVVLFLVSEEARIINGAAIPVYGRA